MCKKEILAGTVHEVLDDLRDVLISSSDVRTLWEDITPLARNEWICWISSAKKLETRNKRIKWMCSDLIKGKRRPCC